MKFRSLITFVVLLGLLPGPTARAQNANYTYTLIADTRGPFSFFGSVSINDAGRVAFSAGLDAGGVGVFTGDGGLITRIDDAGGPFPRIYETSINRSGTVVFSADLDAGGSGIFLADGQRVATIVDSGGPFGSLAFVGVSLNDREQVAFRAPLDDGSEGIYLASSGTISELYHSRGPFRSFGDPSLNNAGEVAFVATFDNSSQGGVFRGNGGPLTPIPGTSESSPSQINDAGVVAFAATSAAGNNIFLSDGGPGVLFASGPDISRRLSLNNVGTVAFARVVGEGVITGIHTGPDRVRDKVISSRDLLLGSTIVFFYPSPGPDALNNRGQVAFRAVLADGRVVIVRADPRQPRPRVPLISPN